jgi:hypothetical protein
MSPLKPPVAVNLQDLDAQELLEWRDLKNAQIDSMMHVWDNPEDERWNDIALDSAKPSPLHPYVEPYPHLTDPQLDLYDRMSEISEEGFCAGWIVDNEYAIWDAITLGNPSPSYRAINPRLLRRCQQLSVEIGGWMCWTLDGPQFVPMAQWLAMVTARIELTAAPKL